MSVTRAGTAALSLRGALLGRATLCGYLRGSRCRYSLSFPSALFRPLAATPYRLSTARETAHLYLYAVRRLTLARVRPSLETLITRLASAFVIVYRGPSANASEFKPTRLIVVAMVRRVVVRRVIVTSLGTSRWVRADDYAGSRSRGIFQDMVSFSLSLILALYLRPIPYRDLY